jgi:NAD(P)H-flavin reductase
VSTTIVKETEPGDVWRFAQHHGTLRVDPDRPVLMVAGGSGLAPLRALLLQMAQRADSPPTHLFYGARFPGELYDLAALRDLAATNPWLRVTAVVDEQVDPWWVEGAPDPHQWGVEIARGRVGDVAARYTDWSDRQVLIAGPPDMIASTKLKLRLAGVPTEQMNHDPVRPCGGGAAATAPPSWTVPHGPVPPGGPPSGRPSTIRPARAAWRRADRSGR